MKYSFFIHNRIIKNTALNVDLSESFMTHHHGEGCCVEGEGHRIFSLYEHLHRSLLSEKSRMIDGLANNYSHIITLQYRDLSLRTMFAASLLILK